MNSFDETQAVPGQILRNVNPASLLSLRDELEQSRLEDQRLLIASGILRKGLIVVNCQGIIMDGHHGARAVAEANVPVDVKVCDLPLRSFGPILTIPIAPR